MSRGQRKLVEEVESGKNQEVPETVTNQEMEMVAKRSIDALGLSEHQWIAVRHRDTDNPHFHVIVNRVHPDTGLTWKGWKDYERLERLQRSLEREFGWREVPGRHALLPGHEIPPRRKTTKAGWYSNKEQGLPPPREGQPAPAKSDLLPNDQDVDLVMPSHLPQTARQLFGCWKRAVSGDAHCQWQMGEMYRLDAGVRGDARIAMAWYDLARDQGHAEAGDAYDRLAQRGFTSSELPRKPIWGDGVDNRWWGIVGRDDGRDDYGLDDRGLDHRLQR